MEEGNKKVEGTEEKPKSLIDRFWWVIPPVFITFVYWPLVGGGFVSFEHYILTLKDLVIDYPGPVFFWSYFFFGFMAVGMLVARRWPLELRIIVPILFSIFGSFVGIYYAMITSDFFLK